MKKRTFAKRAAAALLGLLLLASAAACGGGNGQNQSGGSSAAGVDNAGRTDVNYGLSSDIASLDPVYTTDQISTILYRQLYDTLIIKGADGSWQPKLAESWEVSDDEMVYTFHLRQDVKFNEGN